MLRIEAFLKKKRVVEDFNFSLKKTSSLYTIENLDPLDEEKYIKEFYFNPDKINKIKYIKEKLKLLLK